MKKVFITLILGVITLGVTNVTLYSQQSGQNKDKAKAVPQEQKKVADTKTIYTCPMHPEVVQDKPGKCPKCGMNLVAKEVKKDVYTCPMHPEVISDKPGKCPKCGMNLVKKEPEKKQGSSKN